MRQFMHALAMTTCAVTAASAFGQTVRFIEVEETLPWNSFTGLSANERGDVAFSSTTELARRSFVARAGAAAQIISPNDVVLGDPFVMGIADDGHVMLVASQERDGASWRQLYRYYDNDNVGFAAEVPWSFWGNTATSSAGHAAFYSSQDNSQTHHLVLINPDNSASTPSNPGALPFVFDANRHGVFAGYAERTNPPANDALTVDATGQFRFIDDRGHIEALAINDHGIVVGTHASDGAYPGRDAMFFWDTASEDFTSIDAPDGTRSVIPRAINNDGLVGGHFRIFDSVVSEYAFIWSDDTGFIDPHNFLSDELLGTRLATINDITDAGLVVGTARFADGTWGVWTLQIPAPASSLALGGLAALGLRRRR
jgi:uncharacterized membrane protein